MGHISNPIIYTSMLVESPLEVYGNNCIVDGANLSYVINGKYLEITISPSMFVVSNKLIKLSNPYTLDLDCSIYDFEYSKLLVLGHFLFCSDIKGPNFIYRLAILSDLTGDLAPSVLDNNQHDFVDGPSILLGAYTLIKDSSGDILRVNDLTPNRRLALSYVNNPHYQVSPNTRLELMPFDRVTDRVAELIVSNTGGTGAMGHPGPMGIKGETGGTGDTGGSGGSGGLSRLTAAKRYIHRQSSLDSIWRIKHNLNEKYCIVQVYNESNQMVSPSEVTLIDNNHLTIYFGKDISGTAVILSGPYTVDSLNDQDSEKFNLVQIIYTGGAAATGGTGGTGDRGEVGKQGDIGPQGIPGQQGIPGRDGRDGCQGLEGPQGIQGPEGPQGPQGEACCIDVNNMFGARLSHIEKMISEFIDNLFPLGCRYATKTRELPFHLSHFGKWRFVRTEVVKETNETIYVWQRIG